IKGWFQDLWDTLTEISIQYVIAGVALKTVQTTLTAFGWDSILKFAYPGQVRWLDILACYAASVALNGILPANIGTLVMLIMFTTIIAGATFAAILGGYAVQKIFYTLIGIFVYLYLFLSVVCSFDIRFSPLTRCRRPSTPSSASSCTCTCSSPSAARSTSSSPSSTSIRGRRRSSSSAARLSSTCSF